MAEKACHMFGSTTQVGLTQALGPTSMIAIATSRGEADISGTVSALKEVGVTIRALAASSDSSVTIAAKPHDPAPYERCLTRLVIAKGAEALVAVNGDELCISGTTDRLEELSSCFLFLAHAQDGEHFHFEPLPSDPDYSPHSLGLAVSVNRSGA